MKKLLTILALAALVALAGCKEEQFGILYTVAADGNADGQVSLTFPNGTFDADGQADLVFQWSNDTTLHFTSENFGSIMSLQAAKNSYDPETLKAAAAVDDWLVENFSATSTSGTYYVHVFGLVKETLTGITLSVDREFTNR